MIQMLSENSVRLSYSVLQVPVLPSEKVYPNLVFRGVSAPATNRSL